MNWDDALKLDLVQEQLRKAKAITQTSLALNIDAVMALHLDGKRPEPESPIEVLFKLWWEVVSRADWWAHWDLCRLQPQATISLAQARYRLDFQVHCGDSATHRIADRCAIAAPLIGVELDGHDFHERTRKQVIARNRRDRELQAAGWRVFHFSGSELVRDPVTCVREVWDFSLRATMDFSVAALVAFDDHLAARSG